MEFFLFREFFNSFCTQNNKAMLVIKVNLVLIFILFLRNLAFCLILFVYFIKGFV